jgi:hypothetical protein
VDLTVNRNLLWTACLFAAVLAGCGGLEPPEPVFPVSGEVFVKGRPADGAVVTFFKEGADLTAGQPSATVQPDGSFKLTSYLPEDGAAEGEYRISLSWREAIGGSLSDPEYGPEKLPKKYLSPESSGLQASVSPTTNTLPAFEIKD